MASGPGGAISDVLLSHGLRRSTIGDGGLNFRVRDGTGWDPSSMVAERTPGPRPGGAGRLRSPACGCPPRAPWQAHGGRPAPASKVSESPPRSHARTARTRSPVRLPPRRGEGGARARPISTARLRRSHALHLRPINLVVYEGPYRKENSSRGRLPA